MRQIQILKGIVLVLIVAFLAMNVIQPSDSPLKMQTVENTTLEHVDTTQMPKQDNREIKRFLGITPTDYEQIAYYKQADTMQASEIVLVKFKDHSQQQGFKEAMQKHKEERKNVFEGYAPKEAQLLADSICTIHANYGAFIVDKDAKKINERFLSNF